MKTCSKCLIPKDELLFDKQTRAKDGRKSICKSCAKDLNKQRYSRLNKKILEQVKEWQKLNPERVAAAKARYREKVAQASSLNEQKT